MTRRIIENKVLQELGFRTPGGDIYYAAGTRAYNKAAEVIGPVITAWEALQHMDRDGLRNGVTTVERRLSEARNSWQEYLDHGGGRKTFEDQVQRAMKRYFLRMEQCVSLAKSQLGMGDERKTSKPPPYEYYKYKPY